MALPEAGAEAGSGAGRGAVSGAATGVREQAPGNTAATERHSHAHHTHTHGTAPPAALHFTPPGREGGREESLLHFIAQVRHSLPPPSPAAQAAPSSGRAGGRARSRSPGARPQPQARLRGAGGRCRGEGGRPHSPPEGLRAGSASPQPAPAVAEPTSAAGREKAAHSSDALWDEGKQGFSAVVFLFPFFFLSKSTFCVKSRNRDKVKKWRGAVLGFPLPRNKWEGRLPHSQSARKKQPKGADRKKKMKAPSRLLKARCALRILNK